MCMNKLDHTLVNNVEYDCFLVDSDGFHDMRTMKDDKFEDIGVVKSLEVGPCVNTHVTNSDY